MILSFEGEHNDLHYVDRIANPTMFNLYEVNAPWFARSKSPVFAVWRGAL